MSKTETIEELEKQKRIEKMREKFEKDFGKGTLINANSKIQYCDSISTGSISLDQALGIGGLPRGRVVEIYGPESSGKTTLAIHVIAEAQKTGAHCAFIDVEHALTLSYAKALGVDLDRLEISQPDYGEQALEIASRIIESGDFDVVVLDSVAALLPKNELEGEMGDKSMGVQARLMSQALRKLTPLASKSNTTLIFINQLREKIGVMFGNPETTTGGNALKFYASVRLDIRRSTADANLTKDEYNVAIANPITIKVVKNKMAPPFKKVSLTLKYGEGIDKFLEIIDMGISSGVIVKSGSWFSYNGDKIGQGKDSVIALLNDNPDLLEEIKEKVIKTFSPEVLTQEEINTIKKYEDKMEKTTP